MTAPSASNPEPLRSDTPPRGAPPRLWIVEDHCVVRELLSAFIETLPGFTLAGSSEDAKSALHAAAQGRMDLLILDLRLANDTGIGLLRDLANLERRPKVLVVSGVSSPQAFSHCLGFGISGFVEKSASLEEIKTALSTIRDGGTHFSAGAAALLAAFIRRKLSTSGDHNQEREIQFILKLGRGQTIKSIAAELNTSEQHVYRLRQALYSRWGVSTDQELVISAIQAGILSLESFDDDEFGPA